MICARCLYPDTKPDLKFDDEGICSACRSHEKRKATDWPARQRDLELILEDGRNGSGYDCIVPSSGGKDSHWQVLKLIELGARPLVVTATTCHLTDIGRANIDNLARYATTIEVTANRTVRAKLNRLGLTLVGDISWPEHASIFTVPFRMAADLGIPLIFYGESPQEAYGGPPGTDEAREMTQRWVQEFGGLLGLRPSDFVGQNGITARDMEDYLPPPLNGEQAYFLGQFYEWDSREHGRIAAEHGMQSGLPNLACWWDFENLDNAQTGIHDYLMFLKYGYGRLAAQISVDLRMKRIGRRNAVEIASERDGLYPHSYMGVFLEDILNRIGMTRTQFDVVCEQFSLAEAA